MTDSAQRMVSDYLAAVDRAAGDLPPERRVELVTDLAEHIAAARVDLAPETDEGLREVLDRLGDPQAIAAEARIQLGLPPVPPQARTTVSRPPGRPPGPPPARSGPPPAPGSKIGAWLIALIAVAFTVLLTVCCLGAGLFAMRGDSGPGVGPLEPPEPRPTMTVRTR